MFSESTHTKIRWATRLFYSWRDDRNVKSRSKPEARVPEIPWDLLEMSKDNLNYALSRFICEVTKSNGEDYPGETLYEIIISLQLFFEQEGILINFWLIQCFLH